MPTTICRSGMPVLVISETCPRPAGVALWQLPSGTCPAGAGMPGARRRGPAARPHAPSAVGGRHPTLAGRGAAGAALIRKGSLNTHQHASADQSYPSG